MSKIKQIRDFVLGTKLFSILFFSSFILLIMFTAFIQVTSIENDPFLNFIFYLIVVICTISAIFRLPSLYMSLRDSIKETYKEHRELLEMEDKD